MLVLPKTAMVMWKMRRAPEAMIISMQWHRLNTSIHNRQALLPAEPAWAQAANICGGKNDNTSWSANGKLLRFVAHPLAARAGTNPGTLPLTKKQQTITTAPYGGISSKTTHTLQWSSKETRPGQIISFSCCSQCQIESNPEFWLIVSPQTSQFLIKLWNNMCQNGKAHYIVSVMP